MLQFIFLCCSVGSLSSASTIRAWVFLVSRFWLLSVPTIFYWNSFLVSPKFSSVCKFLQVSSEIFIFRMLIVSWYCFEDSGAFRSCSWVSVFMFIVSWISFLSWSLSICRLSWSYFWSSFSWVKVFTSTKVCWSFSVFLLFYSVQPRISTF